MLIKFNFVVFLLGFLPRRNAIRKRKRLRERERESEKDRERERNGEGTEQEQLNKTE